MVSKPAKVRRAVWKLPKPSPGRTRRLIGRWGSVTATVARRGLPDMMADDDLVCPPPFPARDHPARRVALCAFHAQLSRRTCLRQCKYLNNIVEQDHRRIKRLVRPGLGFGSFHTARRTLAGFEIMAMMRKGQLRKIDGHDIRGQAVVIADLFDSAR